MIDKDSARAAFYASTKLTDDAFVKFMETIQYDRSRAEYDAAKDAYDTAYANERAALETLKQTDNA